MSFSLKFFSWVGIKNRKKAANYLTQVDQIKKMRHFSIDKLKLE